MLCFNSRAPRRTRREATVSDLWDYTFQLTRPAKDATFVKLSRFSVY